MDRGICHHGVMNSWCSDCENESVRGSQSKRIATLEAERDRYREALESIRRLLPEWITDKTQADILNVIRKALEGK